MSLAEDPGSLGMAAAGASITEGERSFSACASFRHTLSAALAVTQTWPGIPQDCWFDAELSGAQVLKARAPSFLSLSYAMARSPLRRRGFYRL
jgi:hypothetical protein